MIHVLVMVMFAADGRYAPRLHRTYQFADMGSAAHWATVTARNEGFHHPKFIVTDDRGNILRIYGEQGQLIKVSA